MTRAFRTALLSLGLSLIAAPCFAQAQVDLSVKKVEVASQTGRRVSLKVYGGRRGQAPNRQPIKVFFVNGNAKTKIFEGQGNFDGSATGFENTISVDLPQDSGRVEVEGGDPAHDPTAADNRKQIDVGGSDLSFDTAVINEKVGGNPNRELVLTVSNNGPNAAPAGCRIGVDVTERAAPRHVDVNMPALPRRAKFQKKIPYNFVNSGNGDHNQMRATITCDADPVGNNNSQSMRLH